MQADHWRHFRKIIIPYLEGEAKFKIFWSNHHSVPSLHFYQTYISKIFFNLDLQKDAYFSLGAHLLIYALFIRAFFKNYADKFGQTMCLIAAITAGIFWFGIQSSIPFTWPLVSLQSIGFILGALILLSLKYINFETTGIRGLGVPGAAILFGLLLNLDFATLFFASGFAAILLTAIVNWKPRLLYTLIPYSLFFLVSYLMVSYFLLPEPTIAKHSKSAGNLNIFKELLTNLHSNIFAFCTAISHPILNHDLNALKTQPIIRSGVILMFGVSYAFTAILSARNGAKSLPLTSLIIYPVFFALAVIVSRNPENAVSLLSAPRYFTNYKLGLLVSIPTITIWISQIPIYQYLRYKTPAFKTHTLKPKTFKFVGPIIILTCVLSSTFILTTKSINLAKYQSVRHNALETLLYIAGTDSESDFHFDKSIAGGSFDMDLTLKYLVDHKLNVFSEQYNASTLLQNHKSLRLTPSKTKKITVSLSKKNQPKTACSLVNTEGKGTPLKLVFNIEKMEFDKKLIFHILFGNDSQFLLAPPGKTNIYIKAPAKKFNICTNNTFELEI